MKRFLGLWLALSCLVVGCGGDLTSPTVKTGKVDYEGKCDSRFPIEKTPAGKIKQCAITVDLTVGDVTCAAGSRPIVFDDFTLQNCGVKGVLSAGKLKCNHGVTFFADGKIKECFLAEPVSGGGKECKKRVNFKADGTFEKCE